jgi:opacity protein-like surface antigen
MAFEYPIFSESIGANGFSVDQPQLGIELTGDLGKDFWYWVGVVNGNGFQKSPFTDSFDNNPAKDVYLRVAKNIGENTIGLFGYFGNHSVFQDSPDSLGLNQKDQFYRIGGDINLSFSSTNIRTAFLYGHDGNFNGLAQSTFYYGGFLECNYYPSDRCVLVGRYDLVQHEDPEASSEAVQQKTTWALTPGIQYLVLPNIKVGFEYQLRQYREQDRALAYLHFAL